MNYETQTGKPQRAAVGGRESAPKEPVSRLRIRQVTGLLLLLAALPAWSAGLQLPSVHRLGPAKPAAHLQPLPAKPATHGAVTGKRVFNSALNPDLNVVSVKVSPDRGVTGTPILVTAVIQNKGAVASKVGEKLHVYCNAYQGPNTPPVAWTCKAPAPHVSAGGMPMWDIPLPAIPGHGRADVALRIQEHWSSGLYYFTHTKPGRAATVQDLVKAKTDSIIQIDAK